MTALLNTGTGSVGEMSPLAHVNIRQICFDVTRAYTRMQVSTPSESSYELNYKVNDIMRDVISGTTHFDCKFK